MRRNLASPLPLEHITPPLQPDLPCKRLVHDLAHAGDFKVERVEGEQRRPMLSGRKQDGEKAIPIRRADEPLAMGECILHGIGHAAREPRASSRAVSFRRAYDCLVDAFSFAAESSASMRVVPTPS